MTDTTTADNEPGRPLGLPLNDQLGPLPSLTQTTAQRVGCRGPSFAVACGMDWWKFTGTPEAAGWRAVLVCYDAGEGFFPMGAHWNGAAWDCKAVVAFGDSAPDKESAEDLAYQHDPEM